MPQEEEKPQNQRGAASKKTAGAATGKSAREARLADALRENLRRRKSAGTPPGDQE